MPLFPFRDFTRLCFRMLSPQFHRASSPSPVSPVLTWDPFRAQYTPCEAARRNEFVVMSVFFVGLCRVASDIIGPTVRGVDPIGTSPYPSGAAYPTIKGLSGVPSKAQRQVDQTWVGSACRCFFSWTSRVCVSACYHLNSTGQAPRRQ